MAGSYCAARRGGLRSLRGAIRLFQPNRQKQLFEGLPLRLEKFPAGEDQTIFR